MDSALQMRLRVTPDPSYITTTKRWTSLYPYLLTSLFFTSLFIKQSLWIILENIK